MIGDRYQPIEQIGTGGMATVWKASDTLLGRVVAIKRLLPHLASDPVAAERFKREAQAAAGLNHPGIITVYDSGEDEEGPFIVLELIEGTTLADHLARVGPLEPATVIDIVSQVASALDHAHGQGVIHRDIKPSNLILDSDGRIRLADFGIARTVNDPATITSEGELVGTITYLAPEILAGEPADPASDVYSLGAVSHELLSGTPPYTAESPAALIDAVRSTPPPSLRGLAPDLLALAVSRAMAKDPDVRPQTAGELAAAMTGSATLIMGRDLLARPLRAEANAEDPTIVTVLPSDVPPPAEPARTRPARWAMGAGLLGVVALAAAAITADPDPGSAADPRVPVAAATTTTSTTAPSTTTTVTATTTTRVTTTTISPSPESVAGEIRAVLGGLQPPEFRPKEVRQVEDRLDRVLGEWQDEDRDDLARELERAFDEVNDFEQQQTRDELTELFIELAELMGFQVEQGGGDDGDDD